METNLLDRMLDTYLAEQTPVTLALQNKSRVSGKISAFDSYVIVMESHKQEIVYRHALSTITRHEPEARHRPAAARPAVPKRAPARSAGVSLQKPSHKPRQAQPPAIAASVNEHLNSSMKEGLLKWMQEQKSAK